MNSQSLRVMVLCFLSIVSIAVCATKADAQTAEVSVYWDWYADETPDNRFWAYAELFDSTDLSQWGGLVFHYNYSSNVAVYGGGGSDSDGGPGLGPYEFEVEYSSEVDDFDMEADAGLTCSVAGPLTAMLDPFRFLSMRGFNHWYDWTFSQGGVQYYERNGASSGKACAAASAGWVRSYSLAIEQMTMSGIILEDPIPNHATCKAMFCTEGHTGSVTNIKGAALASGALCPNNLNN